MSTKYTAYSRCSVAAKNVTQKSLQISFREKYGKLKVS